MFQIITTIKKV